MLSDDPPERARSALVERPSQFMAKRLALFRWSGWFALANGVVATLIGLRYLTYAPVDGVEAIAFASIALPAHLGGYALLPILAIWPLAFLLPHRGLVMAIAGTMYSLGQLLLLLDTEVFAQYRFHLSGFVFDLLLNAGSDVFAFSATILLFGGLIAAAIIGTEAALAFLCWRLGRQGRWGLGVLAASLLLVMQFSMHAWHAWGSAHYNPAVTALDLALPVYYPLTANQFLQKRGWVDLAESREERSERFAQLDGSGALNYPRSLLKCDLPKGADRLNVLFIVIDTWRADTMTDDVTPNIADFSKDPRVSKFTRHLSGGNSTRTGILSLFYGLPATYWEALVAAQRPPVLIEELQKAGYSIEALGSATLTHPQFDRTIFSSVPDLRTTTPGGEAWDKDARITADFLQFLDERKQDQPFFGFLFYNAVHAYSVPPAFPQPFQPYWVEVNHLALGPDFDATPYINLFKTAALYVDGLVGKVLDRLRTRGALENTIVLITSDHGEEFNDNRQNFWGHGSNYTDAQVHVPMLLHWPGRAGATIDRTTSHLDVAPTFMQSLLRCSAPVKDYAAGQSLHSGVSASWIPIASYHDYAIRTAGHIFHVHPTGDYEVLDERNRPAPGFKMDAKTSLEVIDALSRFYR